MNHIKGVVPRNRIQESYPGGLPLWILRAYSIRLLSYPPFLPPLYGPCSSPGDVFLEPIFLWVFLWAL